MVKKMMVNIPLQNHEVPDLRELIGWGRRDQDYLALFERCNFWVGAKDDAGRLIAFGYVCGMALEHGYMEDIMIHPNYQKQGFGEVLVKSLLDEAKKRGLLIVTVSLDEKPAAFYARCGFTISVSGVWQAD
jgi:GNAT superfamily N-acetyltransferase